MSRDRYLDNGRMMSSNRELSSSRLITHMWSGKKRKLGKGKRTSREQKVNFRNIFKIFLSSLTLEITASFISSFLARHFLFCLVHFRLEFEMMMMIFARDDVCFCLLLSFLESLQLLTTTKSPKGKGISSFLFCLRRAQLLAISRRPRSVVDLPFFANLSLSPVRSSSVLLHYHPASSPRVIQEMEFFFWFSYWISLAGVFVLFTFLYVRSWEHANCHNFQIHVPPVSSSLPTKPL